MSVIEAFLILPNHLGHIHEEAPSRSRRRFDEAFETVRERYLGRAVDACVQHRYLTVGLTVALFIVSVGMLGGGVVKFQGFPEVDGDSVQLRVALPQGSVPWTNFRRSGGRKSARPQTS